MPNHVHHVIKMYQALVEKCSVKTQHFARKFWWMGSSFHAQLQLICAFNFQGLVISLENHEFFSLEKFAIYGVGICDCI